jgi:hypothetical protein
MVLRAAFFSGLSRSRAGPGSALGITVAITRKSSRPVITKPNQCTPYTGGPKGASQSPKAQTLMNIRRKKSRKPEKGPAARLPITMVNTNAKRSPKDREINIDTANVIK